MTRKILADVLRDMPPPRTPAEVVKEDQDWNSERLLRPEAIATRGPGMIPALFNVVSLPAWLAVARAAGVPLIEAREIASAPTLVYYEMLDGVPDRDLNAFQSGISRWMGENPGHVLRMEQVAPSEIKRDLERGRPPGDGFLDGHDGERFLDLFDPRFMDTLMQLGEDRIRAYARPYVRPMTRAGVWGGADGAWPVEFRVIVRDGVITGIANYYLQISLDPEELILRAARDAVASAQRLLDAMTALSVGAGSRTLCLPVMPGVIPPQNVTLDFLVAEDGRVLFLEGGPEAYRFSHPCSFIDADGRGRPPEGLALGSDRPLLGFDAF